MRHAAASRRLLLPALAVAALSAPAAACPSCAVAQDGDTLIYIAAFLVIPYVLVTATWLCLRRILASEKLASEQAAGRHGADGETP